MVANLEDYAAFIDALPAPETWQMFGTITSHTSLSSRCWRRRLEKTFRNPYRDLISECIPQKYFWAIERHKSGAFHAHFLLWYKKHYEQVHKVRKTELWQYLFKYYGRSQVLTFEPNKGAVHYCSKYVFKESRNKGFEWDFRG